jgi:hypothetical protein
MIEQQQETGEKPNWNELHVVARDQLFDALTNAENAVFNLGWDQGFKAGWEAHVEHMTRVFAEQAASRPSAIAPSAPPAPVSSKIDQPTAKDLVLQIISDQPGLRGIDIVNELGKGVTPVAERSVRTALHRLKRARKIKNMSGRWYTFEAAANVL